MMRVGSRPLHHPRMSLCLYRVLSFLRSGLLFVVVESSCLPVWPTRFQIPSIFLGLQTPGKPYGLALNKSKTLTSSTSEPIRQLWGHIFLKICSTVSKKKTKHLCSRAFFIEEDVTFSIWMTQIQVRAPGDVLLLGIDKCTPSIYLNVFIIIIDG